MDIEKLKILIKEGEGLSIEFKEKYTPKIDEDIVAYANTKGGYIIIGVTDNKKVVGEVLTNELKARITDLARNCKPSIHIQADQVDNLVVVEVKEGDSKPYSCSTGYYRRLNGVTQKMSHDEIRIMFSENPVISFEERLNRDITWKDISREKIRTFLKEGNIGIKRVVAQDILASLNVTRNNIIKNVGVLFFAKAPRQFILHCQMTLIAFKGKDRIHIFDRMDVQDDLLTQFNKAIFFLEKHLNRRSEIRGVNRYDLYEIPIEALREAVANAIIHRDYNIQGTSLMVEVYDDRVEITNPGGLPPGLSKAALGKVSIRRNELIADLFFRMDKVEKVGTGIIRMREMMKNAGLTKPKIKVNSFFTIIFKRPLVSPQEYPQVALTELEKKLLYEIKKDPKISRKKLSTVLGIKPYTVKEYIERLKKKGALQRMGKTSSGYWLINERGGL
ncbi:winged helix-turn-helix transcriptional regulator [Candidatus Poribacteria bacterium]|nr:winged helix-turn-helix transcriptional regulator [Candidatus Poribacteria bacterium]